MSSGSDFATQVPLSASQNHTEEGQHQHEARTTLPLDVSYPIQGTSTRQENLQRSSKLLALVRAQSRVNTANEGTSLQSKVSYDRSNDEARQSIRQVVGYDGMRLSGEHLDVEEGSESTFNRRKFHENSFEHLLDPVLTSDIDGSQFSLLQKPESWFHPPGTTSFPMSNVPIAILKSFLQVAGRRLELGDAAQGDQHQQPPSPESRHLVHESTTYHHATSDDASSETSKSVSASFNSAAARERAPQIRNEELNESSEEEMFSWNGSSPARPRSISNELPSESSEPQSPKQYASAQEELGTSPFSHNKRQAYSNRSSPDLEIGPAYALDENPLFGADSQENPESRPTKRARLNPTSPARLHVRQTPYSRTSNQTKVLTIPSQDSRSFGKLENVQISVHNLVELQDPISSSSESRIPATETKPIISSRCKQSEVIAIPSSSDTRHSTVSSIEDVNSSPPFEAKLTTSGQSATAGMIVTSGLEGSDRRPIPAERDIHKYDISSQIVQATHSSLRQNYQESSPEAFFTFTQPDEPIGNPTEIARQRRRDFIARDRARRDQRSRQVSENDETDESRNARVSHEGNLAAHFTGQLGLSQVGPDDSQGNMRNKNMIEPKAVADTLSHSSIAQTLADLQPTSNLVKSRKESNIHHKPSRNSTTSAKKSDVPLVFSTFAENYANFGLAHLGLGQVSVFSVGSKPHNGANMSIESPKTVDVLRWKW